MNGILMTQFFLTTYGLVFSIGLFLVNIRENTVFRTAYFICAVVALLWLIYIVMTNKEYLLY